MDNKKAEWPAGIKRTRQRENVLAVLEGADKPLSAAQICSLLGKDGSRVWLSTVYRALEHFVDKGLVVKTGVIEGDMAVYEKKRLNHRHYAICTSCRKIIALEDCPLTGFSPKLEEEGFRMTGHSLQIFGYCGKCGKRNGSGGT